MFGIANSHGRIGEQVTGDSELGDIELGELGDMN